MLFVSPLMLEQLVIFVSSDDPIWLGLIYAFVMAFSAAFLTLFINQYFRRTFRTGAWLRSSIISMIFRKSLVATTETRQATAVTNLISADSQRMLQVTAYVHTCWSGPLQIIVALTLLWLRLGVSTLAGVAVIILLMPVQGMLSSRLAKANRKLMGVADSRVKVVNEILQGIKIIKLYGWEEAFGRIVEEKRADEVAHLRTMLLLALAFWGTMMTENIMVALASFTTYVLLGNDLTAATAFSSIALFNVLRFPLTMLPNVISSLITARVSLRRLQGFLDGDELDSTAVHRGSHKEGGDVAIRIRNGAFKWDKMAEQPTIHGVDFELMRGKLLMIVGPVGSGKSTLLGALLGETWYHHSDANEPSVELYGDVAYAPQQPWITNDTLRQNILFGRPYDEKRYRLALAASALVPDLEVLPGGDGTEIGEKGVTLSGGQKARVALARALYSTADVVLMDDPLSAVDAHVGAHIFEKGINGAMSMRTRVLCTNQLQVIPNADYVLVLNSEGLVAEQGTPTELVARPQGLLAQLMDEFVVHGKEPVEREDNPEPKDEYGFGPYADVIDVDRIALQGDARHSSSGGSDPNLLRPRGLTKMIASIDDQTSSKTKGELVQMEEHEKGSVRAGVYWAWAKAAGGAPLVAVMLITYVVTAVGLLGPDVWIGIWTGETTALSRSWPDDPWFWLGVYAGLTVIGVVFVVTRGFIMSMAIIRAAKALHIKLFYGVIRSPQSFFELTPTGRIINRFSADIYASDTMLPQSLQSFLNVLFITLSAIAVVGVAVPFALIIFPVVGFFYIQVLQYYRRTSRELKRLDAVSKSPIFAHFGQVLNGLSSIRAFGAQQRLVTESESHVNDNMKAYMCNVSSNRWLDIRLQLLGALIVLTAGVLAVLTRGNSILGPGSVGLSLVYALNIAGYASWMVRMFTETEANMSSVERISEYSQLPPEGALINPDNRPPPEWPATGEIEFLDVVMKYRPELDPSLRYVTFNARGGEKIGVVGRTGSGKSSLLVALFRLVELDGGRISIDGVDVAKIGLHDLRKRVTIIPQDPVLFSGTVRSNLDPFNEHTDEQIWTALDRAHLSERIHHMEDGLASAVQEFGENFSVGERQLICLSRALLRESKIIVLDEATASVDVATDSLIQQTIRTEFEDATLLTIAHRLNTIIDSSRILVMEKGRAEEYDTPAALLRKPESIFSQLVKDTGEENAKMLRRQAGMNDDELDG